MLPVGLDSTRGVLKVGYYKGIHGAGSHKIEMSAPVHSVYRSRPKEVAALIEEAASLAG
jgi:hypothetical protein